MTKIILTADSGSTKTDWVLTCEGQQLARISTQGINPFMLSQAEIERILRDELICSAQFASPQVVHFYGAGCRGAQCEVVERALRHCMPGLEEVVVGSDLIGAAKALFADADGIACILGTGSNSGLYVGGEIVKNVSPLGYILGDEGSGAVLGRRLVGDVLKRQLPEPVCADFAKQYGMSSDEIINRVYRQPLANRFLASFAPFLHQHRTVAEVHALLIEEFSRFFRRNVDAYARPDLKVSFVGSIAYYFEAELREAASACGFKIGTIKKQPLD